MNIGDKVKIVKDDVWRQRTGRLVRKGISIPNLQSEFDWYVLTKTERVIGYNEDDLEVVA